MNGQQDNVRTQILGFACLLFALWVLLSGRLEVRFLVIGFFSALVIAILCFPLLIVKNPRTEQEYFALGLHFFKMIPYGLWLIKEIFKSTLDVTREIFKPTLDYEPRIVYFSMPFENPIATVVLANSIILTPGTITIDVMEGGIFEVHALNQSSAEEMLSGNMPRKVAALFGETCRFTAMPERELVDIPGEV